MAGKMIGNQFGNYRIVQKIGEGGMGAVYLAEDVTLKRQVVLKIITPTLARRPELMERFKVEAIAQARLNHSNIITIHSFEQQEETFFIVMEFVKGLTLKEMIHQRGALPVSEALQIAIQILDGLSYAHSKGILHRDIKPANIMIAQDGCAKIGDFGIAKVSGIDGLTRYGATIGTPLYSSPEQIRGEKMGPGTDIYSMGLTLYEMLTGIQPFKSDSGSDFNIQKAHLESTPASPSSVNSAIPASLDAVIMKSLEKSTKSRYRDAMAFRLALQEFVPAISQPGKIPQIHTKKRTSGNTDILKNLSGMGRNLFQRKNGAPLTNAQKRKLLIIVLIPLLILLLIVVAYSAPAHVNQSNCGHSHNSFQDSENCDNNIKK